MTTFLHFLEVIGDNHGIAKDYKWHSFHISEAYWGLLLSAGLWALLSLMDHESLHPALRCHFLVCCSVCSVYSLCLLHVYYVFVEHLIGSVSGALSSTVICWSCPFCIAKSSSITIFRCLMSVLLSLAKYITVFRRIYQNDYCHVKSSFYFILTF